MSDSATLYLVREVHNFGGFFGGDTVTLSAVAYGGDSDEEHTLTIDERALANVRDRHTITAGMLLAVQLAGERIDRAELLGAATHAELRAALGAPRIDGPLDVAQILSYRCAACGLWVAGAPEDGRCRLCGQAI
jgi:hypothetical protein